MFFCTDKMCRGSEGFGSDSNLVPPLPQDSCYCPFCAGSLVYKHEEEWYIEGDDDDKDDWDFEDETDVEEDDD